MAITVTGPISAGGILTAAAPVGGTIAATAYLGFNSVTQSAVNAPVGTLAGLGSQIISGGSGYVTGTYTNVPLIGGNTTGTGALATIIVNAAGAVSSVTITNGGFNYAGPQTLTAANSGLGGSGSGFLLSGGWFAITPVALQVNTYGTGGTSGVGSSGTYSITATGAALDPSLMTGTCTWAVSVAGASAPAAPSMGPPKGLMEPIPSFTASTQKPTTVPQAVLMTPPTPLPLTFVGATTQTSFSS